MFIMAELDNFDADLGAYVMLFVIIVEVDNFLQKSIDRVAIIINGD